MVRCLVLTLLNCSISFSPEEQIFCSGTFSASHADVSYIRTSQPHINLTSHAGDKAIRQHLKLKLPLNTTRLCPVQTRLKQTCDPAALGCLALTRWSPCSPLNRSTLFNIRMFSPVDQTRGIQQIDTLHALLLESKVEACASTQQPVMRWGWHSQLEPGPHELGQ